MTDNKYSLSSMEEQMEGPVPVEAKLCNVIRREIGIPDRTNYTAKGNDLISVNFGYLNGSDNPEKEITIEDPEWGGYRTIDFPPKYPKNHGWFEIKRKSLEELLVTRYYKTVKYYVYKKTFDFS